MTSVKDRSMYYDECIINGVLHYRNIPNGIWRPKTPAQLTDIVLALKEQIQKLSIKRPAKVKLEC